MENTIYSAEDLYRMLRNIYLKTFPYSPKRCLNKDISNTYMYALNEYLQNRKIPARIVFTKSFKPTGLTAFEGHVVIETNLELIENLNEQEQQESKAFIKNELEPQRTEIMRDMIEMHKWLIRNDFIRYDNDDCEHYIKEKFIEKESLFN